MAEPVRILEQTDLEGQLEELKKALHTLVQNIQEINEKFHEYLEEDPAMKERYAVFVSEHADMDWAKEELAFLTEPEEGSVRQQLKEGEMQSPKKDEERGR